MRKAPRVRNLMSRLRPWMADDLITHYEHMVEGILETAISVMALRQPEGTYKSAWLADARALLAEIQKGKVADPGEGG